MFEFVLKCTAFWPSGLVLLSNLWYNLLARLPSNYFDANMFLIFKLYILNFMNSASLHQQFLGSIFLYTVNYGPWCIFVSVTVFNKY